MEGLAVAHRARRSRERSAEWTTPTPARSQPTRRRTRGHLGAPGTRVRLGGDGNGMLGPGACPGRYLISRVDLHPPDQTSVRHWSVRCHRTGSRRLSLCRRRDPLAIGPLPYCQGQWFGRRWGVCPMRTTSADSYDSLGPSSSTKCARRGSPFEEVRAWLSGSAQDRIKGRGFRGAEAPRNRALLRTHEDQVDGILDPSGRRRCRERAKTSPSCDSWRVRAFRCACESPL
jgi:hypothetical protein